MKKTISFYKYEVNCGNFQCTESDLCNIFESIEPEGTKPKLIGQDIIKCTFFQKV